MANELNNQPIAGEMPGVAPEGQMPPAPMPGAESVTPPDVAPMDEASMKQDLDRKFADVENRNNALETKKFISKNKLKDFKIEMIRDIFSMLQKLGVDPADPESIKTFLLSLEQQDPDLLLLFQTIFETLSPDGPGAIEEAAGGELPPELGQEPPIGPEGGMPAGPGMGAPMAPEQAPGISSVPPAVPGIEPNAGPGCPNLMDKYSGLQEQIMR